MKKIRRQFKPSAFTSPKEMMAIYRYEGRRMFIMMYRMATHPAFAWRKAKEKFAHLPFNQRPVAALRARHVPKDAINRRDF